MTARRKMSESAFAATPTTSTEGSSADFSERKSKYTVLLRERDVAIWDDLAAQARKRVGRRITKSELLRLLLAMTADDASLRESLLEQVPEEAPDETS